VAASICIVNAAGENVGPLPSVVDRQSRQMYVMPPSPAVPVFNYYNPYGVYGSQFSMPTLEQGVADNSESLFRDDIQVTGRQRTEDVIISPVAARNNITKQCSITICKCLIFHFSFLHFFFNTSPGIVECLLAGVPDNGYGGCTKGSRAASGNIVVTFTAADQVAVVALVPNQKLFSKIKITCSELDACTLFTVSLEFNHL
jgi:hypothetical protein